MIPIHGNSPPNKQFGGEFFKIELLYFLLEGINIVDMLHFVQLDIFALRQIRYNRLYGRFRYEINPSFTKQTYRVRQHISKIPQGIYLDVLQEIKKHSA